MSKRKIILDCDPGYDDAVAIIVAGKSDKIKLLGITAVAGNTTIENTAKNALNLVAYLGLNVPVCIGQDKPLIKPQVFLGQQVHGVSGLDGMNFPENLLKSSNTEKTIDFYPKKAVDFIIENCLKYPKDITIVTTGPLTNLAMAIRMEPKIIDCISEVIAMGGSIGVGNVTPAAEFNIYSDPESAHIVFSSGIKIKMVGLDITNKTLVLPSIIERMEKINNKASEIFCTCMKEYNAKRLEHFGPEHAYEGVHDPVTLVSIINDKVVKFKPMYVKVDIGKGDSYGRTNCNELVKKELVNAEVGVEIDVPEFWNVIEAEIKKY